MVKSKKIKSSKSVSEDVLKIRSLIIILVIVVAISAGLFFLTDKMIERETNKDEETVEVEFDYDVATVGTMFNRPEKEYYVLLYSTEKNGNDLNSVLAKYRSGDNYIKTYFIDLDLKVNNSVLGDKVEKEPSNSKEVKVKGATLYKLVEGKVTECITGIEKIEDVLK